MTSQEIQAALSRPFHPADVHFKPLVVKGNRALAVAYIDARMVMERLDAVVGVECWADNYHMIPEGGVECRLSVLIAGQWITKTDVGAPSEQPDPGDKLKAAYSDALKRAAVKFGVGRYLYDLPQQWADYDQQKKQFARRPALPDWAIPKDEKPVSNDDTSSNVPDDGEPADAVPSGNGPVISPERQKASDALWHAKNEAKKAGVLTLEKWNVLLDAYGSRDTGNLSVADLAKLAEAIRKLISKPVPSDNLPSF